MPLHRRTAALAGVLLSALVPLATLPAPAEAAGLASGTLDPRFSPNAPAGVSDVVAGHQFVDVAVQQDGKIIAVSDDSIDFYVTRYNPDGTLDPTFGLDGTGVASIDVAGAGQGDRAFAVTVDPQNRIVVAGTGGSVAGDFAFVRLSPDGKAVQIGNHVHIGNPADIATARDVAVQSDGTVVLVGSARVSSDTDYALARFNGATGALIGTAQTFSPSIGNDEARGVAVYPSGPNLDKIVMVGRVDEANDSIGVIQVNANGSPDFSFNSGTTKYVDPTTGDDLATGVSITASGSIVLAGQNGAADRDLIVAQLLPTGGFDGAFNLGAVRTITQPGGDAVRGHPLVVQPDGRIVVVGDTADTLDVGVFRLDADGSTDTSFGQAGSATFDVSGNDDGNAVALDAQGRILVVGDDNLSAGFVARLLGQPDADGDGVGDSLDACPAVVGPLPNGCPPATPPPPPPPAPAPEAVLKGRSVKLDTILVKKSASCPKKATVGVKTKGKQGRFTVTKKLTTTTFATGCRVAGTVRLPARPKRSAKVKVTVAGKSLVKKRLVAVRP